ncbi:MAG: ABC transporter substrate-binding protein [Aggregatilineales bacterium]
MKNLVKLFLLGAAFALVFSALPAATNAQGGGGVLIEATFGSGPNTFSPLFCNDTACARIVGFLYPGLLGTDPDLQTIVKGVPEAMAQDWEISEDGRTVTFKLAQDRKWSDGTPITAKDFLFSWEVAQNEATKSFLTFYTGLIESVEAPDDYTLVVTHKVASCRALSQSSLPFVPSHIYRETAPEALRDLPFNTSPNVTAGIFKFNEFRTGDQTSLVTDPDYPFGAAKLDGFIYKVVPDQTVLVEQFLAGETSVIDGAPVNRRSDIKAAEDRGEVQVFDFPGNSWDYLALNFADPTNPQNGLDADGNPIDQGLHPLFGDIKVRQAIARAIDVDSIIKGAVFGEGTRMAANMIPTSWAADPDLEPIPYDPEAAKALLAEAGWAPGPDGILVKDGVRFSFTLFTNQGNTRREAIGTIVKDQLAQVGIEVDFQTIDFNVLIDRFRSQTYDAFILGWRNGYPDDPDQTQLFARSSDVVGSGSNFTSWSNPRVDELLKNGLAAPGCTEEARNVYYYELQRLFQEELPYIPLFVINGQYAARSNVVGFDPRPNEMFWNIETWTIAQ